MLKWHEHFYVGEGIRDADRIRAKLDANELTPGIYLLTLSENPNHLLEILPAVSLKQRWCREMCPVIFGMARGKDEAIDLACRILKEIYDATGAFGIEDYLKNR